MIALAPQRENSYFDFQSAGKVGNKDLNKYLKLKLIQWI